MFFAFLSSKYFLEKVILVLCVRKIDLLLTPFVSPLGMQDHPSSSAVVDPIPSRL